MSQVATLALDVGGTAVKSGLVRRDGSVADPTTTPVDADAPRRQLIGALAAIIDHHLESLPGDEPSDLAIAFPGPFDYEAGIPRLTHKFASIAGLWLADELRDQINAPVGAIRFVNDAAAAGAGIVRSLGPGQPATILVLTLGTGLGSSLFERGELIQERAGITVAELWRLEVDGVPADELFSATGLAAALGVAPADLATVVARADDDPAVASAVASTLARWGDSFGRFLAPLVDQLSVELVALGGGASAAFPRFGPALTADLPVPVSAVPQQSTAPLCGAVALLFPGSLDPG